MATDIDFVNYLIDQLNGIGVVMSKKMFGEYMVYVNQKPVILVCNNTAYVKMLENIKPYFENGETDFPYKGAKEHYILDVDNRETLIEIIKEVEKVSKIPKKKSSKK
ncbi:MAG: TfoX/Sxy family protein [Defluviitaleaceae bacterium]|nr:TfoX/Sxy family protein [Defluviitaleaceae bacterium]